MILLVAIAAALFEFVSWLSLLAALPALFLFDTARVWVLYLAIMNLSQARDSGQLSPTAYQVGKWIFAFGLLDDFLYNVTWASIAFLDPPREWLVTARLERYIRLPAGWRKALAARFCSELLDAFDPFGCHCRNK